MSVLCMEELTEADLRVLADHPRAIPQRRQAIEPAAALPPQRASVREALPAPAVIAALALPEACS